MSIHLHRSANLISEKIIGQNDGGQNDEGTDAFRLAGGLTVSR